MEWPHFRVYPDGDIDISSFNPVIPMADNTIPAEVFFLDRTSRNPLQMQLRQSVVAAILSKRLAPGARLPSSRKLANYLKVSRITVTLAYQELMSQGYLSANARSAYYVSQDAPVPRLAQTPRPGLSDGADWSSKLKSGRRRLRKIVKPVDWRRYPYPFIYGQMDTTLFDHTAWRDCSRRALGRKDFEDMAGDVASADDPMLVNHISSRTLPRRGISATPAEILVTLGAQNALWLVIQLLMHKDSHAICENPGYPDLVEALRMSAARVTPVDVDEHGLPTDQLPGDVDAVFVTPSHHAPTAATMPMSRRLQLLKAADDDDFAIIEDDYEFEMSFLSPPSPALKSLDRNGRVIYVGSFSKSLFPGLRLGYLVAPEPVIEAARELRSLVLRHPPGHLQRTAAYFLALGHYDALIMRMRAEFEKRRKVMTQSLCNEGIQISGAASFGGTSLWIEGPETLDSLKFADELLEAGVLIEPGAPFFDNQTEACRFFRIAYSSIPTDRIEAGVATMARSLRSHTGC